MQPLFLSASGASARRARRLRWAASALIVATASAYAGSAAADDATAETLYRDGRAAAQAGKWSVACARFAESHDREPAPGTLLNLADCHEHLGKLTTALAEFQVAGRLFQSDDTRVTFAKERAVAVQKRIPKLVVLLAATAPPGSTVTRDELALDPTAFGKPIGVDPGEHAITLTAPGAVKKRVVVTLAEGETRTVEIGASDGAPVRPAMEARTDVLPVAPSEPPKSSPLRALGFVSLGVGTVGIALGSLAGILTLGEKKTADANCTPVCNAQGADAVRSGITWNNVSTAAFIAGGVGLGAGLALLVAAPSSDAPSTVGLRPLPAHASGDGGIVAWSGAF